jgi:hypothetical protein
MARHGAVTVSNKSPDEALLDAYNKMEKVEYAAEILYLIEAVERVDPLPPEQIAILKGARKGLEMGIKPPRFPTTSAK